MDGDEDAEAWGPVYDEEDLLATIRRAAKLDSKQFYAAMHGPEYCQGDVIELDSAAPVLNAERQPFMYGAFNHWLVLANTCDIDRDLSDVTWLWIVPVDVYTDASEDELEAVRSYRVSRHFFLPEWRDGPGGPLAADFTIAVSLHKTALRGTKVTCRLSQPAWILLHACVVRFLARADGRET